MTVFRCCALLAMFAVPLCAGQGLKPRAVPADYPTHAQRDRFAVGAAILTPEQVQSKFATDLNRGYVVVEVAIYPREGRSLDVTPDDFALRLAGTDETTEAADPKAIAANLQRNAPKERDITISPQVGVGWGSGPGYYDPVYGPVGGRGVGTSVGVGVGVGSSRPASTPEDRKTMELELSEKTLPSGATAKPVAGYLYFPAESKKKVVTYDLEYRAPGARTVLRLEPLHRAK